MIVSVLSSLTCSVILSMYFDCHSSPVLIGGCEQSLALTLPRMV